MCISLNQSNSIFQNKVLLSSLYLKKNRYFKKFYCALEIKVIFTCRFRIYKNCDYKYNNPCSKLLHLLIQVSNRYLLFCKGIFICISFYVACASCSIRDISYCPYGSSLKDVGIFSRFSTPSFPMQAVFYFYSSRFLTNFWPLPSSTLPTSFMDDPLGAIHKICRLYRARG